MKILKHCIFLLILGAGARIENMEIVPFSTLPADLIGRIACQLVSFIGTPSIKNEKDIPVIVKYVKAFSLVNKQCNSALNDYTIVSLLIKALAHRFALNEIESARHWHMPGSNNWLEHYVQKSGDYDHFKIVQKIYNYLDEINTDLKAKNIASLKIEKGNSTYASSAQTKCGICLVHSHSRLYTPWGLLELFSVEPADLLVRIAINQRLRQKMKTTLFTLGRDHNKDNKYYEVKNNIAWNELLSCTNILQKIPQHELEAFIGTDKYIESKKSSNIVYEINEFDGHVLPKIEFANQNSRPTEIISSLWKTMKRLYHKETFSNSLQSLEITKKAKSAPYEEINYCQNCKKKRAALYCYVCTKAWNYCSKKCQLQDFEKHANNIHKEPPSKYDDVKMQSMLVQHIDEIPQLCAYFATKLNEEPFFDESRKILPLPCNEDSHIFTIINHKTSTIINNNNKWWIYEFGRNNDLTEIFEHGVYLRIANNDERCTIDQLKSSYETIVKQVKSGWKFARLEDNSNINYKQSEEEWYLFIKQRNFLDEDVLIRSLAKKLGLFYYIFCDNQKRSKTDNVEKRSEAEADIILWVKKNKLAEFNEAFKFFDEATMQRLA